MGHLYIPNSVALRNFDTIFTNNDFDFSDGKLGITFHNSYVAMHPVGLAFYAAIGDIVAQNGIELSGNMNLEITSIPYLQRMGLFRALGFVDPKQIKDHDETGRFIPLRKIRDADELSSFIKEIDPILHTSQNNSRVIKHVFSEVLLNVLEHSYAGLGGNVCATYNSGAKKISIGISDAGRGLRSSLGEWHKVESDRHAIELALTPGVTGTTSKMGGNAENAGAGLFFTKCIAQSTNNHFLIYSGDSYFKLLYTPQNVAHGFQSNPKNDFSSIRSGLPYFPGTLVGIDININDDTAFTKLIEDIGKAYSISVNKAKKDYAKRIRFV